MPSITVVVASVSPIKETAVRKAMKEIYPDWDITYVLVPTESTVSRQPVGIEETTKGAEARLEQVKKLRPDAFIVSIENGLVEGHNPWSC